MPPEDQCRLRPAWPLPACSFQHGPCLQVSFQHGPWLQTELNQGLTQEVEMLRQGKSMMESLAERRGAEVASLQVGWQSAC